MGFILLGVVITALATIINQPQPIESELAQTTIEGYTITTSQQKGRDSSIRISVTNPSTFRNTPVTLTIQEPPHERIIGTPIRARCQSLALRYEQWWCQARSIEHFPQQSTLSSTLLTIALQLKTRLVSWILQLLPEPSAGLLLAIALGDTSGLLPKQLKDFFDAGVIHILVVSGSQLVTLLSSTERFLMLVGLPRRAFPLLLIPILSFYVLLIGLPLPTIRALAVGSIPLLSRALGRKSSPLYTLIIMSGTFSILFPALLLERSWLYSIAATAGIILFSEALEQRLQPLTILTPLLNPFVAPSIAASLTIAPLLLVQGSSSTWMGLMATPIVLSILTIYLPLTMLATLLASLWPSGGLIIGAVINNAGRLLLWTVGTLADMQRAISIPLMLQWVAWGIIMIWAVRLLFPVRQPPP